MTSTINILQQNLEVTEVGDVQVSETVADEDYGGFVRTIRVFNEQGTAAAATLLVEIKIRSTVQSNLNITVPEQEF